MIEEIATTNPLESMEDVRNLKDAIRQLNYSARVADYITILYWKKF